MLALPAHAGSRRQWLLHDGSSVDKDLHFLFASVQFSGAPNEPLCDEFKFAFDDVMIIAMTRVNRDSCRAAVGKRCEWIFIRPVIHTQHDDGPYILPEDGGIGAAMLRVSHPVHVAMCAALEPCFELPGGVRDRVRKDDAAYIEAELTDFKRQLLPELLRFQKSRSA